MPAPSEKRIKTTFLVGTGVAENSWGPVIRAIQRSGFAPLGSSRVKCGDGANSFFSNVLNLYRHYVAISKRHKDEDGRKKARESATEIGRELKDLKVLIATDLREAADSGEIAIRPEFYRMVQQFVGSRAGSFCAFLTTNWDDLLERMLIRVGQDPKRVFHIHFGLDAADLMLLPGERIHEPYRTPEEVSELEKMMSSWSVFDTSERIVVYGHSLDPMEAELRTILHLALSESTGEIVVANLREEIPRVTARLRPLLPQGDGWRISSEIVGPNR